MDTSIPGIGVTDKEIHTKKGRRYARITHLEGEITKHWTEEI